LLSVAAFYKNINDPINITSLTGGAGYLVYANTGKEANVFGLEAETRLNLYKTDDNVVRMILNGTKMWVEQDLLEAYQYNNRTTSGLQGASDLIANLAGNSLRQLCIRQDLCAGKPKGCGKQGLPLQR